MREVTGINIELLSPTAIEEQFGAKMTKSSGFTIGGRVIINTANATMDTTVHELGHIYMAKLKEVNPSLHAHIISKALSHPLAETIREKYKGMKLTEEGIGDEVFNTLLGLGNQDSVMASIENDADKGGFSIKKFFSDLFNSIFGSSKNFSISKDTTLADIVKEVGNDIITNKASILSTISPKGKKDLGAMISGTVTKADMIQRLKQMGLINKYCK
jgi:hypothetical protein